MSLPTIEIATGIAVIDLIAVVLIPSGKEEGDTEGSEATHLGVGVFVCANLTDEFFHGLGLVVLVQVVLGVLSGLLEEDVGIGSETGNGTDDMVVNDVDLLALLGGGQQLAGDLLLHADDDAVLREQGNTGGCVVDSLHSVLNLIETALGRECCGLSIVL